MNDFIVMNFQVLFSGLALGAIYALVALGFVLIIWATNVANFTQGDFAMLGAFAMVAFLLTCLPYWWAVIGSLDVNGIIELYLNHT